MKYIIILLTVISFKAVSQNLVPNSDFETKGDCPTALGQINLASGWFSPNTGTPDYFNDCSASYSFGTEFNKKGGQIPYSGHGYGGILISNLHKNIYYEYLESELNSPLERGKLYCIKMHVSLGNSDYAVKGLGVVISQNVVRTTDPGKFTLPFRRLVNDRPLTDSLSWVCAHEVYKANGNEKFITLGFFGNDEDFIRLRLNPKLDASFFSAYYFIDDVSLEAITKEEDCSCPQGTD